MQRTKKNKERACEMCHAKRPTVPTAPPSGGGAVSSVNRESRLKVRVHKKVRYIMRGVTFSGKGFSLRDVGVNREVTSKYTAHTHPQTPWVTESETSVARSQASRNHSHQKDFPSPVTTHCYFIHIWIVNTYTLELVDSPKRFFTQNHEQKPNSFIYIYCISIIT